MEVFKTPILATSKKVRGIAMVPLGPEFAFLCTVVGDIM
jgi:hypothetical protein